MCDSGRRVERCQARFPHPLPRVNRLHRLNTCADAAARSLGDGSRVLQVLRSEIACLERMRVWGGHGCVIHLVEVRVVAV
jgi:hypothetical protein